MGFKVGFKVGLTNKMGAHCSHACADLSGRYARADQESGRCEPSSRAAPHSSLFRRADRLISSALVSLTRGVHLQTVVFIH